MKRNNEEHKIQMPEKLVGKKWLYYGPDEPERERCSYKEMTSVDIMKADNCDYCDEFEGEKNEYLLVFRIETKNDSFVFIVYCRKCGRLKIIERTMEDIRKDEDGFEKEYDGHILGLMESEIIEAFCGVRKIMKKYPFVEWSK